MTSREKVLAAFEHRDLDFVPVDFSSHRSSGIAAIAYHRLREFLGLGRRPVRVYDVVQQLAVVDEDVLERFGVDATEMGRGFALDDACWKEWVLPDGMECLVPQWTPMEREQGRWVIKAADGRVVGEMPDGSLYFDRTWWPWVEGGEDVERLAEVSGEGMWSRASCPPGPVSDDELAAGAKRPRESTNRAIVALGGGCLFQSGCGMFRDDNWLMILASEPARAHRFLDKVLENSLAETEKMLGLVGEYIDVIHFSDDICMQTGPMVSPAMFGEFFKERYRALWTRAKELADVKVMLHCCGGFREILGDMIECGLDAINPVQISCAGMDAAGLKRDFGRDIVFWGGGCDTQEVLGQGTPQEVAEHTKRQVEILRDGGGFVFQQVHNIMANVRPESIVAMFDAVNA
jgi:uroporphyrinogen decarboxylase